MPIHTPENQHKSQPSLAPSTALKDHFQTMAYGRSIVEFFSLWHFTVRSLQLTAKKLFCREVPYVMLCRVAERADTPTI